MRNKRADLSGTIFYSKRSDRWMVRFYDKDTGKMQYRGAVTRKEARAILKENTPKTEEERLALAELRAARRAEERAGLSSRTRFLVLRRDNYRCRLCGHGADDGVKLVVDHKLALANGGSNDVENLWTLCCQCNAGKGTEDLGQPLHPEVLSGAPARRKEVIIWPLVYLRARRKLKNGTFWTDTLRPAVLTSPLTTNSLANPPKALHK